MEKFKEWYENRHDYARQWKEKNGSKVMGFFCTYVPEEILYAADILPVRALGSHQPQNVTEPHIFGMYCPFCRDVLAQGLQGRYEYLDGITIAQSCLHIRQAYCSWDIHIPVEFSYYINMPHLDRGIDIMNRYRKLMRQAYELRKSDNPPFTGLESMLMAASSQMVDKREFSDYLEGLLKDLPKRKPDRDPGFRLMTIGSEDDDVVFTKMVEDAGSTIVIEDHCTGSRYFWNLVEPQEDRLAAIAARYVDRPACPTKDWPERTRLPHILSLAREWDVQGAVIVQQKFCDPHELDIPAIRKFLDKNGIKTLFLELDVTVPIGQFRIRVDAFLETLSSEDLF
ncbi:MAG: Putative 2-naphthoyl-CoA reductase gamma subunit [Desulfotomaculum sp. 46_296]|nr:MAG: Putative 2-naphthoyl-CoA reductase gamma subunit [Desulfotomaculum sp. 46_296]